MAYKQVLSGRYALRRPIAAGGQASVWIADDRRLGRTVAVKLISAEAASRPGVVDRFKREAIAAAGLVHPHIAQVFDSGKDDDSYYIVMELLEGGSLRDLLSIRPLSQLEAAIVGRAVALALAHAHSKGVLHRDVKPSNVLFTQTGFPKLADFGIALITDTESPDLTSQGQLLGTLSYMAPEQVAGQKASEATDIYALGLVLYESLSGRNPRAGASLAESTARASTPLAPIATEVEGVHPDIAHIVDACVSLEPSRRPASAYEIAEALLPFCMGKTELDLSSFEAAGKEAPTETEFEGAPPAQPASPLPPAPAALRPSAASEDDVRRGLPLRAPALRAAGRLVAALALAVLAAGIGFTLGTALAASIARLLPSGIPLPGV